jgi:hypothetical protein
MADSTPAQHDSGQRTVLIAATCWACDTVLRRYVQRGNRSHGQLTWSCEACNVSWFGPGEPVEAA